jgi:SAM-dependent methyltransferase
VEVREGDATGLAAAAEAYDAVFAYHVLHHAEAWRDVVGEAARVLRPGGRFYSCEMTAKFVDSRLLRAVAFHPADGDRPTPSGLAEACRAAGADRRRAGDPARRVLDSARRDQTTTTAGEPRGPCRRCGRRSRRWTATGGSPTWPRSRRRL